LDKVKNAVGYLIQKMCKKCHVESCKACLYLNEALSGGTRSIEQYLETCEELGREPTAKEMETSRKSIDEAMM